ncbi:MAG: Npun_F0813 family protein [Hormoscilla sp.]
MFILKRQDVEIKSVQHPKRDHQVPILTYQGQTFRLIKSFGGSQAEEAKAYWRDLTDNRGKVCVLLQEPDRHSVWGKVRLEQLASEEPGPGEALPPPFTIACLLLLQAVYIDIEDLLGGRQAKAFEKDITKVFQKGSFPQTDSPKAVKQLLTADPLNDLQIPPWEETHLNKLLQDLHGLGQAYFGNNSFTAATEVLEDMEAGERAQFMAWLNKSNLGKLWETT